MLSIGCNLCNGTGCSVDGCDVHVCNDFEPMIKYRSEEALFEATKNSIGSLKNYADSGSIEPMKLKRHSKRVLFCLDRHSREDYSGHECYSWV